MCSRISLLKPLSTRIILRSSQPSNASFPELSQCFRKRDLLDAAAGEAPVADVLQPFRETDCFQLFAICECLVLDSTQCGRKSHVPQRTLLESLALRASVRQVLVRSQCLKFLVQYGRGQGLRSVEGSLSDNCDSLRKGNRSDSVGATRDFFHTSV